MEHLAKWPGELYAFFGGFALLIAMHYYMAWKVSQGRPLNERIEPRRDNYRQVYRAYRKISKNEFVPFLFGVAIVLIVSGFGCIAFESITERAR